MDFLHPMGILDEEVQNYMEFNNKQKITKLKNYLNIFVILLNERHCAFFDIFLHIIDRHDYRY